MLGQWILKADEIQENFRSVWGYGHNLLILHNRTEFQEILLAALVIYSKSVTKKDPSERLLYVIASLESIFIKSANEPLVQSLRDRMAIVMGTDPTKRRLISELVSKIYSIRSRFVHRGSPVKELELMEKFALETWALFLFLLANHDKWKTKLEFLGAIENNQFSGPVFTTSP